MTNLSITPEMLITTVLLIISIVSFIFSYNKQIKDRVSKSDLDSFKTDVKSDFKDLKTYVDQQDRSVHHRVDEVATKVDRLEDSIERKLDILISNSKNKVR